MLIYCSVQKFRHISISSAKAFPQHRCEPVSIGMGSENNASAYDFDNRRRQNFSLFQYTLGGSGIFRDETGREHNLAAGRAFLVNCPSSTGYRLPAGGTWSFIYILFVGDMARWHTERIIAAFGHILSLPRASPPVDLLLRLFDECAANRIPDKFSLSARLYRFLMELYRQLALPQEHNGIRRAIRLVEQGYADPDLKLPELARSAGMSIFHFVREFRRAAGLTPYAYLMKVRMDRAADYLFSTAMPIKEIAALAGYRNTSYFCQVFRRVTGKTPGGLRGLRAEEKEK